MFRSLIYPILAQLKKKKENPVGNCTKRTKSPFQMSSNLATPLVCAYSAVDSPNPIQTVTAGGCTLGDGCALGEATFFSRSEHHGRIG